MQEKTKRVFITGSSTGLGLMSAQYLIQKGHEVLLHARTKEMTKSLFDANPKALGVVYGDLSSIEETKNLANQVNEMGSFDAVIHNAGVYTQGGKVITKDGYSSIFAVNVLAPYILTSLIKLPKRLVYISSDMQQGVRAKECFDDMLWEKRSYSATKEYSESKLLVSMLAFAVGRYTLDIFSNSVDPGWVPTRMGGSGATDDIKQGALTQCYLATSDDEVAKVSGKHFYHMRLRDINKDALISEYQDMLLDRCEKFSGVKYPYKNKNI